MPKLRLSIIPRVKCANCGFLGYRPGGMEKDGSVYLRSSFRECHSDERQKLNSGDAYIYYSEDGESWDVVGCFHRVWSLLGSSSKKTIEKAEKLVTENRRCEYYIPYQSGYEPAGHNEMRRDKKNQRIMLFVGLINAAAILLAALITAILRG